MPPPRRFTFNDLRSILVQRLGISPDGIEDDLSATLDQLGLDSLAFLELQSALEEEWGVRVLDEDFDRIYTLGGALDYVNERLANQELA